MQDYPPSIFHIDMDAFFASVEQRDNPDYRGKPVIVGARPGSRGVVSAASYEARKFGVHSALPINLAYQRCPQGIFIRPDMEKYIQASKAVMDIFKSYTPAVEPLSIDEAFLDMTGTEKLWGPPETAAQSIRTDIRTELHLTASVGVAPNKFLAKLASDFDKPDGLTITPKKQSEIEAWLAPMKVERLWGVGKQSQKVLQNMEIATIGGLQKLTRQQLEKVFGKHGAAFYFLCRGIDNRIVAPGAPAKSISREHTFSEDSQDGELWKNILLSLSRNVAEQARRKKFKGRTVVLIYRKPDFFKHTRRRTLNKPTATATVIYNTVRELLNENLASWQKLRLIGVGLTGFENSNQLSFYDIIEGETAMDKSEIAMDKISKRFGKNSIFFGGEKRGDQWTNPSVPE